MLSTFNTARYVSVEKKYGSYIDKFKQDVPKNLAVAHVCLVNPNNIDNPMGPGYQRGFMLATLEAAQRYNVAWKRLTVPLACAYVWCSDANDTSYKFYMDKTEYFTTPTEDFWKCAYLKIIIGENAFNSLWSLVSPVVGSSDIYTQLKTKVTTLTAALTGWTVPSLRKRVLLDMETVFSLAKTHGPLVSKTPGRPPYLDKGDTSSIFLM